MGVLDALRSTAGGTDLYECRDCGERLTEDCDECHSCGSREIAHYEL